MDKIKQKIPNEFIVALVVSDIRKRDFIVIYTNERSNIYNFITEELYELHKVGENNLIDSKPELIKTLKTKREKNIEVLVYIVENNDYKTDLGKKIIKHHEDRNTKKEIIIENSVEVYKEMREN